jgi:hypothetical protein
MRLRVCIVAGAVWMSSPPAWAQTRAETARLHVEGPSGTEVLGRSDKRAEWTPVCRAPCDEEVPLAWEYRVHGPGVKASGAFELEAFAGESVVVHVDHAASKGWFVAGVITMSTGGAAAVGSLFLWALHTMGCGDNECQSQLNSLLGAVEAVCGAVFASGAVATFTNLSTTTSQERWQPIPGEQVSRSAGRREALPLPAVTGAPLVTVRF